MGLLILTEHPEGDSGPLLGTRKPRLRMVSRLPGLSPTVWGLDPIRLCASTAWALRGPMPPSHLSGSTAITPMSTAYCPGGGAHLRRLAAYPATTPASLIFWVPAVNGETTPTSEWEGGTPWGGG